MPKDTYTVRIPFRGTLVATLLGVPEDYIAGEIGASFREAIVPTGLRNLEERFDDIVDDANNDFHLPEENEIWLEDLVFADLVPDDRFTVRGEHTTIDVIIG